MRQKRLLGVARIGGKHVKGCKNCPAFAKCTVTYRGSGCAALRSTYGVETDPEIITNADRIRAMDDKEISVLLSAVKFRRECFIKIPDFLSIQDAYKWLQQPAEEER